MFVFRGVHVAAHFIGNRPKLGFKVQGRAIRLFSLGSFCHGAGYVVTNRRIQQFKKTWREGIELRQKFCYRGVGVKWCERIRCARSECYRGGMDKNDEPNDTERGIDEIAAAL